MSKNTMTAVKLRYILVSLLLAMTVVVAVVFYFGYTLLSSKAAENNEIATEANSSQKKVQQLTATKKDLEKYEQAAERASKIVSNSQSYVYQDQIIDDLNRIANKSAIQIIDITFAEATVIGGTPTTPAPAPTPATGGSSSVTATAPTLTGGVKAVTASVRISEKVEYGKMLDFLYAIEKNLTKMSISKVSLRKSDTPVNGQPAVTTDQLTIEVYIR